MDSLGIDIGTVSLKYVRWQGKKGKGTIVSKGDFPYSGDLEDLRVIVSNIKNQEGTNVEVAIGITSQEILKKSFIIPILPKNELREALNWSASKSISTPFEDMFYEYVMLGEVSERGIKKEEALFVGIQKTYVNDLLAAFDDAGFQRIVLMTDIGFVYLPIIGEEKEGSIAVIDVGGRQTGIYIFDDKKLKLVREIMTASESFTDALISGFNLSYDEAEKYKREKGFNDESLDILSLPLDRLVGEVQRTLSVYSQKYPDQHIKKIYIAGRGSKTPNFLKKLKEVFAEEVHYLVAPFEVEDEFLPPYVLCARRESLVNLLPEERKAKEKEAIYKRWIRTGVIGMVVLLLILSLNVLSNSNKLKYAVDIEKINITQKREQLQTFTGIPASLQYDKLMPVLGEIQKRDVTFIMVLRYLSSNLPKDVYIKGMEFDRHQQATPGSKGAQRETQSKDTGPAKEAATGAPKEATKGAGPQPLGKIVEKGYFIVVQGYIFGEVDVAEPALLNLVIKLGKSGIIQDVEVSDKEIKDIKGKKAVEFTIRGRCPKYEI